MNIVRWILFLSLSRSLYLSLALIFLFPSVKNVREKNCIDNISSNSLINNNQNKLIPFPLQNCTVDKYTKQVKCYALAQVTRIQTILTLKYINIHMWIRTACLSLWSQYLPNIYTIKSKSLYCFEKFLYYDLIHVNASA